MSVTFPVASVGRCVGLIPAVSAAVVLEKVLARAPEVYDVPGPLVAEVSCHGLFEATRLAFERHFPLVLSPDAVWLTVAQGFARHVDAHAEALRSRFVAHQGKVTLTVACDALDSEVVHEFSAALRVHLGPKRDLFVCDFSTTGPRERVASEVVLMAAMKHYFDYEEGSVCGIPEVTLEGTPDDWRSVRRRASTVSEFDCAWWIDALLPVLDEFVAASEGRVDTDFWRLIYRHVEGDMCGGGPTVTGWINTLFPYLREGENRGLARWREGLDGSFDAPTPDAFPQGCSHAPFLWQGVRGDREMEFVAGVLGVTQDPTTYALRPAIGWAVMGAGTPAGFGDDAVALTTADEAPVDTTPPACRACVAAFPAARFCVECGKALPGEA